MQHAVSVEGLAKAFGAKQAVQRVSFTVAEGELFGLIGPDGAGKSTLIRMLVTLLKPDSGRAFVDGLDIDADYRLLRSRLGYMPGKFSLYTDLSVRENLDFFAAIFGTTVEENYELVKDIYQQIEPFADRRAGNLSGGMKQKLALSCALIHRPRVLFLDEPTTGVDAVSRQEFWQMLKRLKEGGLTIIVSTPYMDEAALCDRVALMQNGKIMEIDDPDKIPLRFGKRLVAIKAEDTYELLTALRSYPTADTVYPFGEYVHYTDQRDQFDLDDLKTHLMSEGFTSIEAQWIKPNIEDAFMAMMRTEEQLS